MQKQESTSVTPRETKPVVCYSCGEVGHKFNQCPKKPKDRVKRIEIPFNDIKALRKNEIMAEISGIKIPVMIDSGAQLTLVPLERYKSMNSRVKLPLSMV